MGDTRIGSVSWIDLTVADASGVRDFYEAVVGWTSTGVDCGGYEDFCMNRPEDGETVAGVCHQRGLNAGLPPVWMPYFIVEDLDRSLAAVRERGGEVIDGPREMGEGRACFVRDPAGACAALYQVS